MNNSSSAQSREPSRCRPAAVTSVTSAAIRSHAGAWSAAAAAVAEAVETRDHRTFRRAFRDACDAFASLRDKLEGYDVTDDATRRDLESAVTGWQQLMGNMKAWREQLNDDLSAQDSRDRKNAKLKQSYGTYGSGTRGKNVRLRSA